MVSAIAHLFFFVKPYWIFNWAISSFSWECFFLKL